MKLNKDLEYMCEEHLNYFTAKLQSQKEQVDSELASYPAQLKQIKDSVGRDEGDLSNRYEDENKIIAQGSRAKKRLVVLRLALAELGKGLDGDYGYCANCGIDIGLARLDAVPHARSCLTCLQAEEFKERQFMG